MITPNATYAGMVENYGIEIIEEFRLLPFDHSNTQVTLISSAFLASFDS